jgi:hypothetical protein
MSKLQSMVLLRHFSYVIKHGALVGGRIHAQAAPPHAGCAPGLGAAHQEEKGPGVRLPARRRIRYRGLETRRDLLEAARLRQALPHPAVEGLLPILKSQPPSMFTTKPL